MRKIKIRFLQCRFQFRCQCQCRCRGADAEISKSPILSHNQKVDRETGKVSQYEK